MLLLSKKQGVIKMKGVCVCGGGVKLLEGMEQDVGRISLHVSCLRKKKKKVQQCVRFSKSMPALGEMPNQSKDACLKF